MITLESCIEKVLYEINKPAYLDSWAKEKSRIIKELEIAKRVIPEFVEFVNNAEFKIKAPKITRTSIIYESTYFEGNFITPVLLLKYKNLEAIINDYADFYFGTRQLPKFIEKFTPEIDNVNRHSHPWCEFTDFFQQECKARIEKDFLPPIVEENLRIKSNAAEIIKEFRSRRGKSERRAFQRKLANLLKDCPDLTNIPPEFILQVIKISHLEVKKIAAFAKRNPVDIHIAEVDDVVEAQNFSKTNRILDE